ncbi:MAG: cytochrome c maturation protein CcmE [Hyphomicrobiales bacterium]|nr:cytochrome c maturation protein CcmE [Hyphomicrobiales bacterium]
MAGRTRKTRRLIALAGAGAALTLAVGLVLVALRDDIVFFRSPSEVLTGVAEGKQLRLGGMVEDGSVVRSADGLHVAFQVTDGAGSVPVSYRGVLPSLFREGQGVVVEGAMQGGTFEAASVLAKHDENYMPREVKAALEKGGYVEARDRQ